MVLETHGNFARYIIPERAEFERKPRGPIEKGREEILSSRRKGRGSPLLGHMFRLVEKRLRGEVEEYSLGQTSMEQIFLNLARRGGNPATEHAQGIGQKKREKRKEEEVEGEGGGRKGRGRRIQQRPYIIKGER